MRSAALVVRSVVAFAVVVALGACSLTMRSLPDDWTAQQEPLCDKDSGKPTTDIVFGVLSGAVGAIILLNVDDCGEDEGALCGLGQAFAYLTGGGALAVGGLYGFSGAHGVKQKRRCGRAHEAHAAWRDQRAHRAELARRACRPHLATWAATDDVADRWLRQYPAMPAHCRRGIPERRPSDGAHGGRCYPNETCGRGLQCAGGGCVPGPGTGEVGGPCFGNGTCFTPLACADDRCAEPPAVEEEVP